MSVLTSSLVADTRVMSGLRNNPFLSDMQIVSLLNDAYNELRDRFVAALEHWFKNTVTFTLSGNTEGQNTFDLTTIPDYQMDQGLNWYPNGTTSPPVTIPALGSFAERNSRSGWLAIGQAQVREYYTDGDTLYVVPATASAGTYTLFYTCQATPLALSGPEVDLPALLTPWALYLKVHASIAIRNARDQPITDLSTKLATELARLIAMSKKRSEGVRQAPITRLRRPRGPSYSGF